MDNSIFEGIERIANAAAVPEDGDYIKGGLLYCGKCNTPKQCRIVLAGRERIVGCTCKCRHEKYEAEQAHIDAEQKRLRIKRLREIGITDGGLLNCTFDNAYNSPEIQRCKAYVENWEQVYENNIGLLLHGNTGGGKTFAAACIANALIDKGVSAMITNFPRILNSNYDKDEILEQIRNTELVVIDDLGTERSSEYALETTFLVIDERAKAKKPLIVTTNMTPEYMKQSKQNNTSVWRIYERVLGMCQPVPFDDNNWRAKIAKRKAKVLSEIFGDTSQEKT